MKRATRLNILRKYVALGLCFISATPVTWGQNAQSIAPERPTGFIFVRPYMAATIPPIRTTNSVRLQDLIRAGKLYLTAQDAIALALENNIDIESARYTPFIDEWNLQRFEAGGALPGVPSGTSTAAQVASGQGVVGSQNAAGVSTTGQTQTTGNAVGATISQIGPVTPALDPVFQDVQAYSHRSNLFPLTLQSGVYNLIMTTRNYNVSISQGLISGGTVKLTYTDSYLEENAPTDVLNPANGVAVTLSVQHNFLNGFGVAVNSRNITIARANLKVDDLNFKGEVINIVANVLNLYYGLAADNEDVKAKQSAVTVAQQFYENNKKQVELGTMAPLDVTTAEAQVASSQQDLVISQTTLAQQELQLKDVLSRNGVGDPLLREVQIIPLDRIEVPEQDNLPPLKQLINTALANRTDIAANKITFSNNQTSALGTANGVLPQLAGIFGATNNGLNGEPQPAVVRPEQLAQYGKGPLPPAFHPCPPGVGQQGSICEFPDPYFVGNIGVGLGQMVRRNFPSEHIGAFIAPILRNRQAQADYAIDQLGLRQTELEDLRTSNQVGVDVANQVVGLQQSRVRYLAAVKNRVLQQQLLDAEQKRFSLGASTTFLVVQQQRDLATAQSTEIAAMVAYSNAQVALNQVLGTTLEANHVTIQEARNGRVTRPSVLPATLPSQP